MQRMPLKHAHPLPYSYFPKLSAQVYRKDAHPSGYPHRCNTAANNMAQLFQVDEVMAQLFQVDEVSCLWRRKMFSLFREWNCKGALLRDALTVLISEDRPKPHFVLQHCERRRLAAIDGEAAQLQDGQPASLVPTISQVVCTTYNVNLDTVQDPVRT